MYAGGLMSSIQRCFSDLVCQPLVTYYVVTSSTLLSGHVVRLGPAAHDDLRLMVDTDEGRKAMASWRRPSGRPRNIWLNKFRRMPTLNTAIYAVEIWDRQGSRSDATVHSDYATTTTMMMMKDVRLVSKIKGKTNFSRHLQFVRNRDCWVFENHWSKI